MSKRAEEQKRIDDLYANGQIDRKEWSMRFDILSSSRWTEDGPVKKEEKREDEK